MRKKIAVALAGIFVVCLVIFCLTCHGKEVGLEGMGSEGRCAGQPYGE